MSLVGLDLTTENPRLGEKFVKQATNVLNLMLENNLTEIPDRRAFFLTTWLKGERDPFQIEKIGTSFPDQNFQNKCFEFSPEKIGRTFRLGHVSSYVSRNIDLKNYGGAVVLPFYHVEWGISISGLREHEDEVAGLGIGYSIYKSGNMMDRVEEIVTMSKNQKLVKKVFSLIDANL